MYLMVSFLKWVHMRALDALMERTKQIPTSRAVSLSVSLSHSVCVFFLSLPLSLSLVTVKLERSLHHDHVHPRQLLGPMQGWPPRLLLVCLGTQGGIAYQSMGQTFTQAGMLPHCIWDVLRPQR